MRQPTRRDLIQWGAAAGTAAWLGPASGGSAAAVSGRPQSARLRAWAAGGVDDGEILDVAIVGAGISGLYAGWRLLGPDVGASAVLRSPRSGRGGPPVVTLFELSDRLGGRLFSVTLPEMPHLRAELGGMRFLANQTIVARLVDRLGLAVADFPVDQPENLAYLRGRHLRLRDWTDPAKVPYDLRPDLRGLRPAELMLRAVNRFVPDAQDLDRRGWDALKPTGRADGRLLIETGFWNLLLGAVGVEGYNFLRDALGYSNTVANWNAVEAMQDLVADFVGDLRYRTLRDGLQAIPLALAARFTAAGGRLATGHQLRRIDRGERDGEPLLTLTFVVWPDGRPLTIEARHVVLALPRRSIELLDPDSFLFAHDQFLADLGAVAPQPGAKLFLGYDRPWWAELGLSAGRSVTDLPLRQVYYLGVEGEQPGADPANRNALLLASYTDGPLVQFWGEYPPSPARPAPVAIPQPPRPPDLAAPAAMVAEAQRQLRELHGPAALIPEPYVASFQDWGQDPFGGAFHFWQVGARSWEVIPRMRRPIADANLSICGEAWSNGQGWVLGALNTAERMLHERFGLPRPAWLPADIYLGA